MSVLLKITTNKNLDICRGLLHIQLSLSDILAPTQFVHENIICSDYQVSLDLFTIAHEYLNYNVCYD